MFLKVCLIILNNFTVIFLNFGMLRIKCHSQISDSLSRVRTGPGKPGKSWNFIMAFSRTGKSWKKVAGPGKFWKFVKLS